MSISIGRFPLSAASGHSLLPDFIHGPENRLVGYVCSSPESVLVRGNPLLLFGNSGVGKSTIARELAAAEASLKETSAKPSILSAVDFARDYAKAVDADAVSKFRESVIAATILVVEDVHLIADKIPAQDELASLIARRVDEALPTILTCRRLPIHVQGLRPGLVSRMLPGLSIPLAEPQCDTRRLILHELASVLGIVINNPVADKLDALLPNDASVPVMSSLMNNLMLSAGLLAGGELSLEHVDLYTKLSKNASGPSVNNIAKAVARKFGLRLADLKSSSRQKKVVRARSLAMYLSRDLTALSLKMIGDFFGGRDHSTVIHAIQTTEDLLASDTAISLIANDVVDSLKA